MRKKNFTGRCTCDTGRYHQTLTMAFGEKMSVDECSATVDLYEDPGCVYNYEWE